ncbi:MAG: hypothetical protein EPN22_06210 [Nitrospirae bacterium]|nr:MAG: hypothetical protein EPN22_06210 [Nitrospirota bacterium]
MNIKTSNPVMLLLLTAAIIFTHVAYAHAQESWQAEFEAICSKTNETPLLSPEELKELINRSDKLKPVIEALDETRKKIYLRRLQKCRDLYQFALDEKSGR